MLTKTQKKKVIDELADKIRRQKFLIFTDIKGTGVGAIQKLRREIKKTQGEFRVAKKTLISLAFKQEKKEIDMTQFVGSLALAFGYDDPIVIAKILANFEKKNEYFKILGGLIEDKFLNAGEIKELAKIPSREELLVRLVGSIKSPISNLVNVLRGNLRNLVGILTALQNK